MALAPGSRLGPYEITAQIGAGGMGEVYRARDGKLDRDVALKILPDAFAQDAERLARFQREARLLASLNHPNIAQVHGFEDSGDRHALVMELVEGPTLAERIALGPVPIDETLHIAKQIADALEAAHEHGIVHRDLKPANVKVRDDGTVKVLDFGLAKALSPEGVSGTAGGSESPTVTSSALTERGSVLGTAAYMAPEQAKGRAVDKRADIWAFGCVLYELLTARRAFDGDDVSEVFAAVLKSDPDWSRLPPDTLPAISALVRACLRKDVRQRVRDIGDARLALGGAFEVQSPAPTGTASAPHRRTSLPAIVGAVLAALAVAAIAWTVWPSVEPRLVTRFVHQVPAEQELSGRSVAVSPDGRTFVYATNQGLYLRAMNDLDARVIPGTEQETARPAFSPNGQEVAYWAAHSQELKRVALGGGTPIVIARTPRPSDLDWGANGTIVFTRPEGIWQVPATGGTPVLVIEAESGERIIGPQMLPGGDAVLFSATTGTWDESQVVVRSLSTARRTVVVEGAGARYVPTGHLVYAVGDELYGRAFDLGTLTVAGTAVPLGLSVRRGGSNLMYGAEYNYALSSESGTLVHVAEDRRQSVLVWVDRDGREEEMAPVPGQYVYLRLSPDGGRVLIEDRSSRYNEDVLVWGLSPLTRTRLIPVETRLNRYPEWTPDGRRIVYHSGDGVVSSLAADGSGAPEVLLSAAGKPYFFLPDGRQLVFRGRETIDVIPVEPGGEAVRLFAEAPGSALNAELSPNHRWMAYQSDQSGQFEVYVRPFPNVDDARVQVSTSGGVRPLWSPDGRELLYVEAPAPLAAGRMMSAVVNPDGTAFSAQAPRFLLDWPYPSRTVMRTHDVSPDGQRFLAIKPIRPDAGSTPGRQIVVIQHWTEELKRLARND